MLGGVREGLGHQVIACDLDRLRQLAVDGGVKLDGHRGAAGERLERLSETTPREDRGVNSARDLLELRHRTRESLCSIRKLRPQLPLVGRRKRLGRSELET